MRCISGIIDIFFNIYNFNVGKIKTEFFFEGENIVGEHYRIPHDTLSIPPHTRGKSMPNTRR
jgi:hypothetical protein